MFIWFRKRKESQKASAEGLTQEAKAAEEKTQHLRYCVRKLMEWIDAARPGGKPYPLPTLSGSFAQLFSFEALERRAEENWKVGQGQLSELPEPIELHSLLNADVSRLEELLLTKELSRIGACYVVHKTPALDTPLEGGEVALLIAPRGYGFEVWFA
jgi:hypothetical protein